MELTLVVLCLVLFRRQTHLDETKIYCQSCGTLCGMIVTGSKIRKESVMLCRKCFNRMHTADEAAKQTVNDMPDFLKNLFTGG